MKTLAALCLITALAAHTQAQAASGRYLTWIDDNGRVHNSFVGERYGEQQRQAAQRISRSDLARLQEQSAAGGMGGNAGGEQKRRYFTWVDASGNLQNSFYAAGQVPAGERDYLLPSGKRSTEYIDADVLEGRGYSRPGTVRPTSPGWTSRAAPTTPGSRPRAVSRRRRRALASPWPTPRAARSNSSARPPSCRRWTASPARR